MDFQFPRASRYQSLDLWRGVACLMVVVFHSSFYLPPNAIIERLWMGVPMFFVISGYCIASTADKERRSSRGVRSYFWRRFRRIFPPYWIAFVIFALLVILSEFKSPGLFADLVHPIRNPLDVRNWHLFGNVSLTETWMGNPPLFFLGHAWTLCYEEQFYAVTGLLLLLCPRRFFTGAAIVTVLTYAAQRIGQKHVDGFFFDGYWFMFAFGVGVYYWRNHARRVGKILIPVALSAGVLLALAHPHSLKSVEADYYQYILAAAVFALALIPLQRFDGKLTRCLPLMKCGQMCYSLYLIHWPVCKLVSHLCANLGATTTASAFLVYPLCMAASIAAAWPFHVYIERRFLNQSSETRVHLAAARAAA